MNKNKKIIIISMAAVVISALASIMLLNKLTLKKPVFLMNYREIGVDEGYESRSVLGDFYLDYISDAQDTRRVTKITFKEIPDTEFFVYSSIPEEVSPNKDISGRYRINTVQLTCCDFNKLSNIDGKMITKADIEFDDGLTLEADLGKIVFYKEERDDSGVNNISGRSSNDGTASREFKVNEDVRIEKIDSPLYDEMEGVYSFDIHSEAYDEEKQKFCKQEESLKKDSYVTMESKYINTDILKKYTIYDIRPQVHLINNENLRYSVRYYNMSNRFETINSNIDGLEIYKYLKARGEL